jgi:hypothetical protein
MAEAARWHRQSTVDHPSPADDRVPESRLEAHLNLLGSASNGNVKPGYHNFAILHTLKLQMLRRVLIGTPRTSLHVKMLSFVFPVDNRSMKNGCIEHGDRCDVSSNQQVTVMENCLLLFSSMIPSSLDIVI